MSSTERLKAPHPAIWLVLYLPFGALGGFISVALTFLATRKGLSISEGALLVGTQLLISWLKWLWAPVVDITLTPKRWYWIATGSSAVGVFAMSAMPLSPETLPLMLAIIAAASFINSIVGMAVEAMIGQVTRADDAGRVGAWFQAGNLGGSGLGGGLGLYLLEHLPAPWMSGAILGAMFLLCGLALRGLPDLKGHSSEGGLFASVRSVVADLGAMVKTKGGLLAGILCFLPVGTGAAQAVLTQATVADYWGATGDDVALLQGVIAGIVTAVGCFIGGYACQRFHPRTAYAGIGVLLALVAVLMAISPATRSMYVVWNMTYALFVGLAYAAFTAVVINAMGAGSAATKYNIFASLSNFPIWWVGLLLGLVADMNGPRVMLLAEAGLGVVGVGLFAFAGMRVRRTALAD